MTRTQGQMPEVRTGTVGVSAYLPSSDDRARDVRLKYLCQCILLLGGKICISEEQGVVLNEDKIREYSRGVHRVVPCITAVLSRKSRWGIGCRDRHR